MNLTVSSANILRHDLLIHLKRNLGTMLTALGIMLVLIPFATAGVPGDSIFNRAVQAALDYRLINSYMTVIVYFASVGIGLITGIVHFAFLSDISRAEFFFLIGIRRDKVYFSRLLAGVISLLGVIIPPMVVSLGLNIAVFGTSERLLVSFAAITGGLLLQAFLAFLLTALACELAGTGTEIVMYILMLLGGFSAMVYGLNQIIYHVVWENIAPTTLIMRAETGSNFFAKLVYWNPITFYLRQTVGLAVGRPDTTTAFYPNLFLVWGLLCVALIFLNRKTMRVRHIEQSGKNGCRIQITRIVVFLSMFVLFAIIFALLDQGNRVLAIIVAIAADLILYAIWQQSFIHQHPGAWVLATRCLTMLVAVIIVFVIAFGAGTQTRDKMIEEGHIPRNEEQVVDVSEGTAVIDTSKTDRAICRC